MTDVQGQLDDDAVRLMAFQVWSYKQGEMVSLLIHLGDRLGLYRAMAGAGSLTSDELAQRAGLAERWVREWVSAQAAAGLVDHRVDDGVDRFELTPAGRAVLLDEGTSLFSAVGAFTGPTEPDLVDDLAECFRTGIGLPYERLGPRGAHRTERMLGPWARLALVPVILPMLDGMVAKLEAGARVVDVGCGSGVALETMAQAFPASHFVGYDPSGPAVEAAREKMADAGLDNVEIVHDRGEDLPAGAGFDLALTFDCLHDMTHPDATLAAIRAALADDGTLLVKEIRCADTLTQNMHNPMLAMMFGFSLTACMSSATSEPDGMGLGTVGLPESKLRELATAAGFATVVPHDPGEPSNVYYEVRP